MARRQLLDDLLVFNVAIMVVNFVVKVLFLYLLRLHRHNFYILARTPDIVLVCSLADVVFSTVVIFEMIYEAVFDDNFPCYVQIWTSIIYAGMLGTSYFLRTFLLYSAFVAERDSTALKRKSYFKPQFLKWWFLVTILITGLLACLTTVFTEDAEQWGTRNCHFYQSWIALLVLMVIFMPVVLWCLVRILTSHINDLFNIMTELKMSVLNTCFIGILEMYSVAIDYDISGARDFERDVFPINYVVYIIVTLPFILSVMHPIIGVLGFHKKSVLFAGIASEELSNWSMSDILNHETARELFKGHARRALCIESVLFYDVVLEYEVCNPLVRPPMALTILQTYIRENSDLEVNIPSKMRLEIEATLVRLNIVHPTTEEEAKHSTGTSGGHVRHGHLHALRKVMPDKDGESSGGRTDDLLSNDEGASNGNQPGRLSSSSTAKNENPASQAPFINPLAGDGDGEDAGVDDAAATGVFEIAKQEMVRLLHVNLYNSFVKTPAWSAFLKQRLRDTDDLMTAVASRARRDSMSSSSTRQASSTMS